jgi:DNA primase
VTDVWAVGPPAVALFSNSLTAEQYHQLIRDWGRGTLVVLLDGDAADEANKLARLLKPHFKKGTVVVDLPSGFDPGDLPREEVWTRIRAAARESGVPLPV